MTSVCRVVSLAWDCCQQRRAICADFQINQSEVTIIQVELNPVCKASIDSGTVDVTIHKVLENGTLKEVYATSGGPWGGTTVNEAFRKSIADTVGEDIYSKCLSEDQRGWIDFEKAFEDEKRKFCSSDTIEHRLHLPKYFTQKPELNIAEKFKTKQGNALEVEDNFYLVIHSSKMEKYFDTAIDKIKKHISKLLQKEEELGKISSIMLVGGFAESSVVQEKITNYFKTKTVFVPSEVGVAVLRGYVMLGHNPDIIAERISPWTYGVHTRKTFNKERHDRGRIKIISEKEYVDNAFDRYLKIGESVVIGTRSLGHVYEVINPKDCRVFWKVYKSKKKDPVYCDEEGVNPLGMLAVELPQDKGDKKWRLELNMTCRGTELEASVSDADTQEQLGGIQFDFLRSEYGSGNDFIQQ